MMSKYRIIFEVEEKSVSKASVRRVFQKYENHKWSNIYVSDCDSVSAYVIYNHTSKGAGCFDSDRDVVAEVTVMLLRAILDGIHEDLGSDPEAAAERLENDFADLIKDTADRFIQYAEQDKNVLVAAMVRHFIATLEYVKLAEMLIAEAREVKTEYGQRVEAVLREMKIRNLGFDSSLQEQADKLTLKQADEIESEPKKKSSKKTEKQIR